MLTGPFCRVDEFNLAYGICLVCKAIIEINIEIKEE